MKSVIAILIFATFSTFAFAQMATNDPVKSSGTTMTEETPAETQVVNSVDAVNELNRCLQKSLRLPEEVVDQKIKGTVLVNIHLDETGKIQSLDIVESLGSAIDNAILKALSKIKKVDPVTVNGVASAKTIQLPIRIQ